MNNVYYFVPVIHRSDDRLFFSQNPNETLSFIKILLPHKMRSKREARTYIDRVDDYLRHINTRLSDKPYIKTFRAFGASENYKEIHEVYILFAEEMNPHKEQELDNHVWIPLKECMQHKRINLLDKDIIELYLNNQIARFD